MVEFAEKTIVHGGGQSMPLYYDNMAPANYSEAQRTWTSAQDWTLNGADTLSLFFRGQPTGFLELSADHIVMNGLGTDIFSTADQGRRDDPPEPAGQFGLGPSARKARLQGGRPAVLWSRR